LVTEDGQKSRLIDQLKRRVTAISNNITDETTESSVEEGTDESDSFSRISVARRHRVENTGDEAGAEVDRYLADRSTELSSLTCYPNIRKLYITLNTGLPASAAVRRLFSLGGCVFSPLRSRLSHA
jgi:hypothetical protein